MRLRDVTAAHHRLLRDIAARISNGLEAEFTELPGEDSPNIGVLLRERRRHVAMEFPAAMLLAADDLAVREAIRVRLKTRRDRMLFQAPPAPLPKRIAAAATPGFMGFGFGRGGGGGPRGRR